MRRAEYLLLPSVGYEQFPVVIAEAFASGLPVIASRLGALCELVEPGRTGLLFTPGNAADLADCLKFAANRPEAMRAMSANARAQYELKYTPERNYEQLLGIYSLALNEHPRE
jgi:glycosyltransferase involved in cell wall biosynthesis